MRLLDLLKTSCNETVLSKNLRRRDMKHCPWCYEPAIAATWTPRHGWIDLCQRHYIEVRTINCVECNTEVRIKDSLCHGCRILNETVQVTA